MTSCQPLILQLSGELVERTDVDPSRDPVELVGRDPETGAPVALGRKMATIPELLRSPPARLFIIVWVVLNCLVPLLPLFIGQNVEIAWQAHLGGFFTGLLLVPFFEPGHGKPVPATNG